jgi:hypothetical protein
MKERNLRIPIKVDPARRNQIKELRLFSSSDLGKTWQQIAVAHPDQDGFQFNAPMDGEYWFSVQVVDQQGRRDPEDIYQVPPSQKIVVDTLKPVVRIVSAERQGEEALVAWEIQEEHPDLASMKLEYRPADAPPNAWYTATFTPALSGQTRFRVTSPNAVAVRLQIQDQAGNVGSAAGDLSAVSNLQAAPNLSAAPAGQVAAAPAAPPSTPSTGVPAPPAAPLGGSPWEQNRPTQPLPLANEPRYAPDYYPQAAAAANYQMAGSPGTDPNLRQVLATSQNPATLTSPALTPGLAHGQLPPLVIVNNKQIALDYKITKSGPSGVGKVDLWMTKDDGRSWELYMQDQTLKPPMVVDLPGEGIYGFCLVLESRAGLAKPRPVNGDVPEIRVEVDSTPPSAELYAPEPDPRQRDCLILRWSANDRNLIPNPITLQWADQRDGTWTTIQANLPNSGSYSWKLPENIPYRVYLRLIATDTAANSGVAETSKPVCIDLKEPEGHLTGVVGSVRKP